MSLDDAKVVVLSGSKFGDVFPMIDEPDRDDFREWFVRCRDVPARINRSRKPTEAIAKVLGYTGNVCPSCGSSRMVRNGTCERCEDCGDSTSCA